MAVAIWESDQNPPRMGLEQSQYPARVLVMKTEDLLRYEAELHSVKVAFGAADLVLELALPGITRLEDPSPRRLPRDNPPPLHPRRCSAERLP